MASGIAESNWRHIGQPKELYRELPHFLYSWIYSPSGRYGLDIHPVDVNPENRDTHEETHRYFIVNMETGTWSEYQTNTGLFKSLKAFYWLTEDAAVVTDFSRFGRCFRQHILRFDHVEKRVDCDISRGYAWDVDEIHRFKGANGSPIKYKEKSYMAVCGYSEDLWAWTRCLFIPFNPLSDLQKLELFLRSQVVNEAIGLNSRHYRNLQPICCGSKMFFRLSEDFEFTRTFDRAYPLPNVYFTVDLDSLQLNAEIPTWIGMADDSLGILNIPCSSFTPETNRFSHYSWNNEQFIVNWYEFDDSCVDEDDEPRECEVFITDVLNSTIAKSSVQMKWSDWLTLHPSGALFHWNHEKGLLQCLNKPRPLVRPPSLFELAKQRLLMTRAHEQDDKFINWLLFDV